MSFDIRDGNVIAGRSEDEATVFLPDTGYNDPGEAAADLLDALSAVPGLTPPEAWPEASGVLDLVTGADKTPVRLEITDPHGEWRFNVTIGAETAELICTYDDSSPAVNREDDFYVRPPYQVDSAMEARLHSIPSGHSTNGSSPEPRLQSVEPAGSGEPGPGSRTSPALCELVTGVVTDVRNACGQHRLAAAPSCSSAAGMPRSAIRCTCKPRKGSMRG